jgi:hypothetical protein
MEETDKVASSASCVMMTVLLSEPAMTVMVAVRVETVVLADAVNVIVPFPLSDEGLTASHD